MTAIITEKFRQHNATKFFESFSETSGNTYYLFVGKTTPFTSGTSGGFKQIGISTDPDNSDTGSANANAYVVFNTGEHVFKLTTGV